MSQYFPISLPWAGQLWSAARRRGRDAARCVLELGGLRPRPGRPLRDDWLRISRIRQTGDSLRRLTAEELRVQAMALRMAASRTDRRTTETRWEVGLALVNEAVRRSLGWECFDTQLLAACAMLRGAIAEMATGEGKSLVQALAGFVLALSGQGVHVMTSNAYLAQRDYALLAPVLGQLGMSVGLLRAHAGNDEKRRAYLADITFGPGYEFGFDYLRDQSSQRRHSAGMGQNFRKALRGECGTDGAPVQRGHGCAIVDEADCVMIDEAMTPLLLSAGATEEQPGADTFRHAAQIAEALSAGMHYQLDSRGRSVRLTAEGQARVMSRELFPVELPLARAWPTYIEQALFARHCLCRDVDYIVHGGQVVLVDQHTGRIHADRSLRDGLHQAVEAKEGVAITGAGAILARISRQQYYRLYKTVCGMTGTARGAEGEFRSQYALRVILVPPRRPCRRIVLPIRCFVDKAAKRAAIVQDVRQRQRLGQPILVGTRTIDESRRIQALLEAAGVPCQLLNGIQDAEEAALIAQAGHAGVVTIATNIAGRGTDIRLGPGAAELGGLHVIATEPHVSSRVDRQLIGRAARQGDPGSCQLFVAADDELITTFAPTLAQRWRQGGNRHGEVPGRWEATILRLQRRAEFVQRHRRVELTRREAWLENTLARMLGRA